MKLFSTGSRVYTMLLEASQAFGRVNYVKLFALLLNKRLCSLVCRLLAVQSTGQSVWIKLGVSISNEFFITNGVKQGGGVVTNTIRGVYGCAIRSISSRLSRWTAVYGCFGLRR